MHTRPASLHDELQHLQEGLNRKSLVQALLRPVAYAKYALAGAIGGIAVVHTLALFFDSVVPSSSLDQFAGVLGGCGMLLAAKAFKAV